MNWNGHIRPTQISWPRLGKSNRTPEFHDSDSRTSPAKSREDSSGGMSPRVCNYFLSVILICAYFLPHFLVAHGNLHKEIEAVSRKIKASPKNVVLWLERADLSRQHADFDGALRDLIQAKALNSKATEYDFRFGRLFALARWHKSALPYLDRFLQQQPDHVDALLLRAKSRYVTSHNAGACKDYDAAIPKLERPQPGQFLEQALAHASNPVTGPKVAIARLESAMERIGDVPTLQEAALQYEIRLRDHDAALERIDRLLAEAPRKERWLIKKGQILLRAERVQDAVGCFREVTKLVDALPSVARERPINQDLKRTAKAFLVEIDLHQ